jgi:hypothetical protein
MMRRRGSSYGTDGFFDLSDRYASLDTKKYPLAGNNEIVPWEEFRSLLEQVWRKPESERKSRAGCKPMDAMLMFKTLVLGALYNLPDDQVECQIRGRIESPRFYRRVFCSKLKQLYQRCSDFHRRPPPLIVA